MQKAFKYTKKDAVIAFVLAVVLSVVAILHLNAGHPQGGDFAAYINTAIAMVEGKLEEQGRLNLMMHASPLTFLDETADSLNYVWGLPLILSVVYRLVGFDRITYNTMVFYKLPGAMCFVLTGVVVFLFFRRRFSASVSLFISFLFSLHTDYLESLHVILTDSPFLLLGMLSFLLVECAVNEKSLLHRWILLCCLGITLFAAHAMRLNGITIVVVTAFYQLLERWRQRKQKNPSWLIELIPYAVFAVLVGLSSLVFPSPTSNSSDLGLATLQDFYANLSYYRVILDLWMVRLFPLYVGGVWYHWFGMSMVVAAFIIIGMLYSITQKDWLYAVFSVGMLIGILILPYRAGLRYLYPILPLLLLYATYGVRALFFGIQRCFKVKSSNIIRLISKTVILASTCVLIYQGLYYGYHSFWVQRGNELPKKDMYSTDAVDMYRYIQAHTPGDSVIAFYKPRPLYLNTKRLSFKPQLSIEDYERASHAFENSVDLYLPYQPRKIELTEADYLLLFDDEKGEQYAFLSSVVEGRVRFEPLYSNGTYELFQLIVQ